MSEKKIKVTDKRIFTADGELRSEFRHLDESAGGETAEPTAPPPVEEPSPPPVAEPAPKASPPETSLGGQKHPKPGFLDLVGVVAQPIALYLGDAKMPDGESMENLELARLYIDLLEVLQQKTEGNLSSEEKGFLEDLLYQLRLRYVEKTQ